jgi:hypothetical protein
MRTTVEITEEQHRALSALAQRRGVRGFSLLVQEALASYLQDVSADEVELLLGLEGMLSEDDEHELRARVDSVRSAWRSA